MKKGLISIRRRLSDVIASRSGGMIVYAGLLAPILIGAVGLSVDVAAWHVEQRQAQAMADSAATAGALEILRTGDEDIILQSATLDAEANGFSSAAGDTLTANHPPLTGINTGAGDSVEVVVRTTAPTFLAGMFLDGPVKVSARAVARADINDTCVWALNRTVQSAIKIAGGAAVTLDCGMRANSADADALTQSGTGSCLTATKIKITGGFSGSCITPTPLTGVNPVLDPLASLDPPAYGGCDYHAQISVNANETVTLSPGVYCGDIKAVSNATIVFLPGLYVLDRAGLSFGAQSSISGNGVTFYLTKNSGTSDNISISAGASVDLVAAIDGPLPGVLFYQDRAAPSNVSHSLTGGGTMNIDGIVYFPNQNVKFTGGSATAAASTIIVADTVSFTGASEVGNLSGSTVEANTSLITARLVE